MIESLDLSVADGAVGEERGVATPAGVEQRLFAANIEIALLLPSEARVREILGRRARSDGNVGVRLPRASAKLLIRGLNSLGDVLRPCPMQEFVADGGSNLGKRCLASLSAASERPSFLSARSRRQTANRIVPWWQTCVALARPALRDGKPSRRATRFSRRQGMLLPALISRTTPPEGLSESFGASRSELKLTRKVYSHNSTSPIGRRGECGRVEPRPAAPPTRNWASLRFAWGIASHAVANVLRPSLEGHAPKLDANQRDTGRWRSVDATVLTLDLQETDGGSAQEAHLP